MDAIHIARGATGRDMILKIEGSYHGHHDAVMVSVYPPLEELGDRDDPVSVPYGAGYPRAITELTRSVPFNDAQALAHVLERLEGKVAALIMEPAMMNINIVPPRRGLPRGRAPHHLRARREADLRRGQDGRHDLARRRDAALRRARRTSSRSRRRRCGGLPGGAIGMTDGARRGGRGRHRAPVRHVQRQPARDGGRAGDAHRGAHRGRLRAARVDQRAAAGAAATRSSSATACPATRRGSARRDAWSSPPSRCASTATT